MTYHSSADRCGELLENEIVNLTSKSWNKLDKQQKRSKLLEFAGTHFAEHKDHVERMITEALSKGKLLKVKEVEYDRVSQRVTHIPSLVFCEEKQTYRWEALPSTKICSQSLTPKRNSVPN
jgi:hypothetical protein